ncbi:protein translocase subunit SecF [Candidatus Gottesmanbacteria bacterium]|nr:protein translocase subunit SecF [Candidatus Gottesmanbacteria bacterium]
MLNILGKKWYYFVFSGLIIVPGLISLILWGVRPSIDFSGGTLIEVQSSKFKVQSNKSEVKKIIEKENIEVGSIIQSGTDTYLLRLKPIENNQNQKLADELKKQFPDFKEIRIETVGPTIGKETTQNAAKAIIIASIVIVLYVAWAFRQIPKPYSSFKFGICAVVALIHDILVVVGLFSIFGHFYKIEVDSLFITALLTVMGFSVHDTIVVFDRIRENLRKMAGDPFTQVVNESIVQTLARSLSTSLTVLFTLFALLLFGGESIRWFIVALLIGIASGTYSSIFNAAPLLVVWEEWGRKKK